MIDTLKLSKKLQAAQMPPAVADALADGLAEAVREDLVTKHDLEVALAKLETKLIGWVVGTVGLGTAVQIGLHFWK